MQQPIDFPALQAIGLGATMQARLACGVADPLARPMRLLEVQRGHWLLHDGHQVHRARCATALQQDLLAEGEALAVGDWVLARPDDPGGCCITCRLLPVNQLTRRTGSGGRADPRAGVQRQALVSNIDTALLVMGLDHDFQLRRLERYLALVQLAGVAPVLVLSKADTVAPALAARRLAEAADILPSRTPALALDMRQADAAGALSAWLQPGQTLVLLGSSGAGKSTLANTLLLAHGGAAGRDTGAVRDDDSRGRHTTTVRSLLPLPGGACIIDTPGLRALRLDVDDAGQLADAFGDVARLAPQCRFRDCQHRQEPGCAVRQALDGPRLDNYHKLLREAQRDQLTVLERQAQLAQWKQRGRAGAARARAKRQPDA
ncbi:ribosome small subunit-dependent GTPase A [Pseudaquabacterium pictum]|uniref:Small ribosomal subunit biogenesis GTPase RsgA n=1 Tax=Pseudaquabacterium pictum TaxID=2315236 RepID=A0A480AP01_9BURK|nr:ribosome small subunit-dependent GTPase A [Rubrivivax pictus]GCL62736.1 putative ribosome biogenesis GTPase RsgA [Rubrivivax pictus]